jgi:hypothetical protein
MAPNGLCGWVWRWGQFVIMPRPDRRLPEATLSASEMNLLLAQPNISKQFRGSPENVDFEFQLPYSLVGPSQLCTLFRRDALDLAPIDLVLANSTMESTDADTEFVCRSGDWFARSNKIDSTERNSGGNGRGISESFSSKARYSLHLGNQTGGHVTESTKSWADPDDQRIIGPYSTHIDMRGAL